MNNPFNKNRKYTVSKKVRDNKDYFYKECRKKGPCEHQLNRINYILRKIDKEDPHMLRLMQAEYECDKVSKWSEEGAVLIAAYIYVLGAIASSLIDIKVFDRGTFLSSSVVYLVVTAAMIIILYKVVNAANKKEQASYALHWINLYLKYGYVPDRDYDIEEEQEIRKYRKGDQAEKMHPYQEPEEEQE